MMLPPEVYAAYYEQGKQFALAGHRPEDLTFSGGLRTYSDYARIHKLLTIISDLPRILYHFGLDIETWREAEIAFNGPPFKDPQGAARYDVSYRQLDVREDAERIAAAPLPTTTHLLRRGGRAVTLGPAGELWIVGHALREGRPLLRAMDFISRAVLWDGPPGLFAWDALPPRQSFHVFGAHLFIAHEKCLIAINLTDGRHLWTAALPGSGVLLVGTNPFNRAPILTRVSPEGQGKVVAIVVELSTSAHAFLAFDQASGALLWQIEIPTYGTKILAIPGIGFAVHGSYRQHWAIVVEARTGAVLCSFGARDGQGAGVVDRMDVVGRAVLLSLKDDRSGVQPLPCLLAVDPSNGQYFEFVLRTLTVASDLMFELNDRPVWVRWSPEYKGLAWMEPFPDQRSRAYGERFEQGVDLSSFLRREEHSTKLQGALVADSAIVIAYTVPSRGYSYISETALLAVDGRTLEGRFEVKLGRELASFTATQDALATRGSILVVALNPTPEYSGHLVSGISMRSGRRLWDEPIVNWQAHMFVGDFLVIATAEGFTARRPDTGELLAEWPPPDTV